MTRQVASFLFTLAALAAMCVSHADKDQLHDPGAIDEFHAEDSGHLYSVLKESTSTFENYKSAEDIRVEDIPRKLVSEPLIYLEPVWFKALRKEYGRRIKKCKYKFNLAPETGDSCRRMRVGDYTCGFGLEECADGSTHPATLCHCDGGGRRWKCETFDACSTSENTLTKCPAVHPLQSSSIMTCQDGLTCVSDSNLLIPKLQSRTQYFNTGVRTNTMLWNHQTSTYVRL